MNTRRRILALTGAVGVIAAAGPLVRAASPMRRTASQTTGPFYPRTKPADSDADLTRVAGRDGIAQGQVIQVAGRVLNATGTALAGVAIEIWQANAHGRYDHPADHNDAPLDPNFQGYARLVTDAQGRYRFTTIKPSGYPAGRFMRPPHIHVSVTGKQDRLVTQMYFAGEPLNDSDPLLAQAGSGRESLIVTLGDSRAGNWDIVLENG
jgi:protocatechuate 3,4-dioxygenase beta subunit